MRILMYGAAISMAVATLAYGAGRSATISVSSPIELSTVKPAYPCGSNIQEIAKGVCTVYTPNGPVPGNFAIKVTANEGGGQCGITVYQIDCL